MKKDLLKALFREEKELATVGNAIVLCPICGENPAQDCGYGHYDNYDGEFDCFAPEEIDVGCEDCKYLACSECVKKGTV